MIVGGNFRVFLSAVSSEFEKARSHVASDLRSRGVEVKVQEDFRQEAESTTTLQKLHDYIRECSAVVCIIGSRSGAFPPQLAAQPFVEMGIRPPELSQASYTQWELVFARHYHKRLSLYVANPDYPPDKPPPSGDDAELQQQFVTYLMGQGLDYTPFSTVDELCRRVLREEWPQSLSKRVVRRLMATVAVGLLAFAAAFWHWGPLLTASQAGATPLSGSVDVKLWSPRDASRKGLSLSNPNALPLQNSDQIRVEAALNRPAYAYVIWIDSQGVVTPIYPWESGDWSKMPQQQKPVSSLKLPQTADEGWSITGASGMETLMLLVRETPLPANVKLQDLLKELPPQAMQSDRALAWFDDGKFVAKEKMRGVNVFNPKRIEDPLLQTQKLLQDRLGTHFPTTRAVSFAHDGK